MRSILMKKRTGTIRIELETRRSIGKTMIAREESCSNSKKEQVLKTYRMTQCKTTSIKVQSIRLKKLDTE